MNSLVPPGDHDQPTRPSQGGAARFRAPHDRPPRLLCLALLVAGLAPASQAAPAPPPAVGGVTVQGKPAGCPPKAGKPDIDCLNAQLKAAAKAGEPAPSTAAAVKQAQTPSKAGTFSQSATAERLGKNFGKSAQPYRPPPPAYSNPIMTGKSR